LDTAAVQRQPGQPLGADRVPSAFVKNQEQQTMEAGKQNMALHNKNNSQLSASSNHMR
jgi:hypothetical protein